jgi:hypothetical protein
MNFHRRVHCIPHFLNFVPVNFTFLLLNEYSQGPYFVEHNVENDYFHSFSIRGSNKPKIYP